MVCEASAYQICCTRIAAKKFQATQFLQVMADMVDLTCCRAMREKDFVEGRKDEGASHSFNPMRRKLHIQLG